MNLRVMSTDTTARTILLALESGADVMALEAAAELAVLLRGTLQGVFVENVELLRLAQLPFAREISLSSNTVRQLQSKQLERELRAQAEQARGLLERQARRHSLQWSFRVERGAVIAAVAGNLDIAVVGRPQLQRRQSAVTDGGGTVLVPYNGSPGSRHALELATTMTTDGAGLLVLLAADQRQLHNETATFLARHARHAQMLTVADFTPRQLLAIGRQYRCRLLLLGTDLSLPPVQLQQLLESSRCPVALVR